VIFLAGKPGTAANARVMTDQALVGTVLFIGGGLYLATFLWITQSRVRDLEHRNDASQGREH